MDVLSRRMFLAVTTLTTLASTTRVAAQRLVLPNGHRRSGRNLEIKGTVEAAMVGIPITLGGKGPFLFEVATVGRGFSVRSELAETMGAMVRPDGSAALPPAYVGDLALERSGSAHVGAPGWGLPQPFAGVIGLDVFGDFSVGLNFRSGEVLLGPVSLGPPDGRTIFAYERFDEVVVPVSVDGAVFDARVSSGQIRAPLLVNPGLAVKLAASQPQPAGDAYADGRRFELYRVALRRQARVGVTELPVSWAVYPGPSEENSLGALGLAGLAIQLDRRNRRVRIVPAA